MTVKVLVVENDPVAPLDLVESWLTEAGLTVDVIKPHAGDVMPAQLPAEYQGLLCLAVEWVQMMMKNFVG